MCCWLLCVVVVRCVFAVVCWLCLGVTCLVCLIVGYFGDVSRVLELVCVFVFCLCCVTAGGWLLFSFPFVAVRRVCCPVVCVLSVCVFLSVDCCVSLLRIVVVR